jgi:hypothetical protein
MSIKLKVLTPGFNGEDKKWMLMERKSSAGI